MKLWLLSPVLQVFNLIASSVWLDTTFTISWQLKIRDFRLYFKFFMLKRNRTCFWNFQGLERWFPNQYVRVIEQHYPHWGLKCESQPEVVRMDDKTSLALWWTHWVCAVKPNHASIQYMADHKNAQIKTISIKMIKAFCIFKSQFLWRTIKLNGNSTLTLKNNMHKLLWICLSNKLCPESLMKQNEKNN